MTLSLKIILFILFFKNVISALYLVARYNIPSFNFSVDIDIDFLALRAIRYS